jgi:hypothetical protein
MRKSMDAKTQRRKEWCFYFHTFLCTFASLRLNLLGQGVCDFFHLFDKRNFPFS